MNEKKLDIGEKTLDQILFWKNSKCQKTIQDIQCQRDALKDEVDKYALKLLEEVNKNMESIQDSISKEKKKVITSRHKGGHSLKTAEEILTTFDMSFFFENADIIAKSIDDDVEGVNVIDKSVPKFKPGSISQSNVGTLFEDISSSSTLIDMKVSKEFTTGLKHCQFISACSDGSLWIGDSTSKVLQKVKPEGNILTTVLTFNTVLPGMAVTHNNDVLIADVTEKLKLINGQTGKVSYSKCNVDSLRIISVHITSDHKVIVGAVSPGKAFPVTGRRLVIVMDQEGNHLNVYEQDEHKHNIFSYPWRITSTSNWDIFVIDCLSDNYRGRVLLLGKDGGVLNDYNGYPNINTDDETFRPVNITTTPSNNIIVSDVFHHYLHILDSSGNLLFYYNTKDIGIEYPYSIVFTSPTTLYLGCSPPTASAKLYKIQNSGF